MDQPRTRSSRRTSRWPTSGSTCSARRVAADATPARLEGDGRGEDDLAYLRDERDFRNVHLVERVQTDFGVTMARLLIFCDLPGRALRRPAAQHRRDPRGRRRQGRQGGRLPPSTTPPTGCCGSATAPRVPRADAGAPSTPSGPSSRSCSTPVDAGARGERRRRRPRGPAPRRARATRGRGDRGHPDRAGGRAAASAAAAAACTPRTSATCSPRCSTCPLSPGGHMVTDDARQARREPGPSPPRCPTRRSPWSPSPTSASCATSTVDDGAGCTCSHADLLRLPGDGRHRRRRGRAAHAGRVPARRRRVRALAGLDHRLDRPTTAGQAARRTASRRRSRRRDAPARCR